MLGMVKKPAAIVNRKGWHRNDKLSRDVDGTINVNSADLQRVEVAWLATEGQYMQCSRCGRTKIDTEGQRILLQSARGSVKRLWVGAECRSVMGD